jgi:hypothetical protein
MVVTTFHITWPKLLQQEKVLHDSYAQSTESNCESKSIDSMSIYHKTDSHPYTTNESKTDECYDK